MKNLLIISAFILLPALRAAAQHIVPAKYAAKHAGQKVKICDKVYGTDSNAEATLLYLGSDHPGQLLTIVIKAADVAKFKEHSLTDLKGKDICVTGIVTVDKGKPEIIVSSPKQIRPFMVDSPVGQKFK
jgi:DNA/RNA endonuclease YhcR with UshA esterase domain